MILANNMDDAELRQFSEEHIAYEFSMLLWSARILAFLSPVANQGVIDWTVFNGLLNTFVIHARNLVDFLYNDGSNDQTDIVLRHYVDEKDIKKNLPAKSKILSDVNTKANKQVAHLTTNRIEYEKMGKAWDFIKIALEIKKVFFGMEQFIPEERFSDKLRNKIKKKDLHSPIIENKIILNSLKQPIGLEIRNISDHKE